MVESRTAGDAPDIAAHGIIGDLRSAALVSTDGTIDWFCPERFDRPSVFASILDEERGGAWRLSPTGEVTRTQQYYLPDTAVLVTRFLTPDGVIEVQDFMPVLQAHDPDHQQRLVRRVAAVRGRVPIATEIEVRHDYGASSAEPVTVADGVHIPDGHVDLMLTSTHPLSIDEGTVRSEVTLEDGEVALFVLEVVPKGEDPEPCAVDDTERLLDLTSAYWRGWLATSSYEGRWRSTIERSAITLKLMCHEPTGGVIASPTTSLPEEIGGGRNWDYRYVWIRDAAFTLYGLLRLGFTDEAGAFTAWLSKRIGEADADHPTYEKLGPLRVLYDLDGKVPTEEHELDHLSGHRGSRPVRVGNAAVEQLQLDIYGELIDSIYLFDKYGSGISHDGWTDLVTVLDWIIENWDRDDHGMWEIREDPRPHTTSRLMCWVAVERMIRVARKRGLPGDIAAWGKVRDEIYERIMSASWNAELDAFTQTEGGDVLDAGLLLMPLVKFTAPGDPRFLSTLAAVEEHLVTDSLVFRYDPGADGSSDGLEGAEGTFSMCSFWYVEALTRAGRHDEARLAFEKMLTYGNHLGLYAEQVGLTGEQLGNFPQAFTHLSLISAATNLDRALG